MVQLPMLGAPTVSKALTVAMDNANLFAEGVKKLDWQDLTKYMSYLLDSSACFSFFFLA